MGTAATIVPPLHPNGLAEEITGGDHSWEYGLLRPCRRECTIDTPLRTLADEPEVWRAVTTAFGKYLPGVPIVGDALGVSLNTVLGYFPEPLVELQADLVAAISS